jgi:hypothetical protein
VQFVDKNKFVYKQKIRVIRKNPQDLIRAIRAIRGLKKSG